MLLGRNTKKEARLKASTTPSVLAGVNALCGKLCSTVYSGNILIIAIVVKNIKRLLDFTLYGLNKSIPAAHLKPIASGYDARNLGVGQIFTATSSTGRDFNSTESGLDTNIIVQDNPTY